MILNRFLRIENFEKNRTLSTSEFVLPPDEKRNYIKSYLFQTYDPEFNDTVCPVCKKEFPLMIHLRGHLQEVHLKTLKT